MKSILTPLFLFGLLACVPVSDGADSGTDVISCPCHDEGLPNDEGLSSDDSAEPGEDSAGPDASFVEADTPYNQEFAVAILAGGCFWGVEDKLKKIDGVLDTTVGYSGGTVENATYKQVSTGNTGHAESVKVLYNPSVTPYARLIERFLETHDPTAVSQKIGYGSQYRSAIFYVTEEERQTALDVIEAANASGKWDRPIATEVTKAGAFWIAEEYHQDYFDKH